MKHHITPAAIRDISSEVFSSHGFNFSVSPDIKTENHTLLFNISGGVQYEDVLSGDQRPPVPASLASMQRCIRMDGLSKVGVTGRHHIAFDMLGHFNFFELDVDGAKNLALNSAVDLLGSLGVTDLFARAHPTDDCSRAVLLDRGVPVFEDEANTHVCNHRRRSGVRVELGRLVDDAPTEMWNIVFTTHEGVEAPEKLSLVAFDSGASIDRLVAAANGLTSDYAAAHWQAAMQPIRHSGMGTADMQKVADLAKAIAVFAESDVHPGPKGREYVVRKVHRTLARFSSMYSLRPGLGALIQGAVEAHELTVDSGVVQNGVASEFDKFDSMVARGKKVVTKALGAVKEPDANFYAQMKSTHGLDPEIVDAIIASTN